MKSYLKKHWLAILVIGLVAIVGVRSLILIIQNPTPALSYQIGFDFVLFSAMIFLFGWLINYFRSHRKVKNKGA